MEGQRRQRVSGRWLFAGLQSFGQHVSWTLFADCDNGMNNGVHRQVDCGCDGGGIKAPHGVREPALLGGIERQQCPSRAGVEKNCVIKN